MTGYSAIPLFLARPNVFSDEDGKAIELVVRLFGNATKVDAAMAAT
jgi:hypothetical protein